ncbi:TM0106 family RecB-like putative nuclease [Microbacterium sp. ASV49]|uniref:TM0106 family RecB-like putative nuclease n=1 Tax=Microbacterium candidum TaxID=3041922 RepID=A0ABT7MWU3_9MICO|nr:bifunctional RecB family nuclease/DEAD/DEAH box helicase [Microbacterium sp. ASV49]MDL9978921.1 TM0106 family RecB-like putative nuclease [Microbacterium sp. ASV49]
MRFIEAERRIVWSASDLKAAAECEFAWLRAIDAKLGRVAPVEEPEDATLARAGRLGDAHERRVLERYLAEYGDGVVEIPQARSSDAEALAAAVELTNAALASDATVVYQAAFATPEFVGFADFLLRDPASGTWVVQDSKLARHARVTALMQLAAYVDQLDRLGVPRADRVELLLGDGTTSIHQVDDLLPTFRLRRDRLRALVADRRLDLGDGIPAIAWGDARGELGVVACGRCATCTAEVEASRDLLLVAGVRPVQRERLRDAGIATIDALADAPAGPERMNPDTFAMLQTQARLQLRSEVTDAIAPTYEVVLPQALGALPRPDHGDIFFDFEGDPLYTESDPAVWGIDYLFGWVDMREQYTALWAHSFADEKKALETFVEIVNLRRQQHPAMHIYHYAPYETSHLVAMAARYGVCERDIDRLLREGVFVDLYPIVRRALRVGSRSYSIKKLEPLYMGDEVRTSDVQKGDVSIERYVEARAFADDGQDAAAQLILDDLADYNRYDCVSTRRLRDWLVDRAREANLLPSADLEPAEARYEPSPHAGFLEKMAAEAPEREAEALRLAAAAIDYYPREAKTFWAGHFERLREPLSVWEDTRDTLVVDPARSRVAVDWHIPDEGRSRTFRRRVELRGELAPGTLLREGSGPYAVYDLPAPFATEVSPRWIHTAPRSVTVVEELDDGAIVEEYAIDGETWSDLPVALAPAAPPKTGNLQKAIDAWADALIQAAPEMPSDPATDILLRRPPRTTEGAFLATRYGAEADVDAIARAVADLDRSYLPVQGPPGTGKTYVGSHVIARLVAERKYRIGVVAQSHAVVENLLDRVVAAGLDRSLVGKVPRATEADVVSFTPLQPNGLAPFTEERAATGFVVGGTAWDFTNETRIARGGLDLLVIDEAGQFSLASTIAVSLAAKRLLLLGDPQQLPQVSQGTHPAPVDTSALGWVMEGVDVVGPEEGFFLAQSRRMHPAVAEAVSWLSYDGELAAHPSTALRALEGVEPGVIPLPVRHHGNATASPDEAEVVVELVRSVVGRAWTDVVDEAAVPPRPLRASDVIVVTPYNAQQVLVEEALAAAGFGDVPVGTVDKFQGQEAAVAIVSLAASSGRDAPRGLEFLLLRNRINVAISRAKHTAYVVFAPGILDDLPRTPDGVARLSAFARLVEDAQPATEPALTVTVPA